MSSSNKDSASDLIRAKDAGLLDIWALPSFDPERPVAEVLDSLDEQLGVCIRRQGRLTRLVAEESYLKPWPSVRASDRPRIEPF